MGLLPVPALVHENIVTLFIPGNTFFSDLRYDIRVPCMAKKDGDCLFYIIEHHDYQLASLVWTETTSFASIKPIASALFAATETGGHTERTPV